MILPDSSGGIPNMFNTDRKSTRLNSSHTVNSYAVFCLKNESFLSEFVRDHFHEQARRLARNASTKFTYEQTIAYLEGTMKTELRAAVVKDVQTLTKQLD